MKSNLVETWVLKLLCVFLIAIGCSASFVRADVYVDVEATATGTGTAASPANASQAAAAFNTLANKSTLNATGLWRVDLTHPSGWVNATYKGGATWRQWPGRKRFVITGAVGVTTGWSGSGGLYSAPIGSGRALDCVTYRYYDPARANAFGGRKAFLRRVADAGTEAVTDNSWFYDTASGVLLVHCSLLSGLPGVYSASIDPADAPTGGLPEIEYVPTVNDSTGSSPLAVGFSTGVLIDGVWVDRIGVRYTGGSGYGVQCYGCTGSTVRNCKVWDVGYHGIGFVNAQNVDNTIDSCSVYCMGGYLSSTGVVMHGTSGDVTRPTVKSTFIYNSHVLGLDGQALAYDPGVTANFGYVGIFAHVGAGPIFVRDYVVTNCTVVNGPSPAALSPVAFDAGNLPPINGAVTDPAAYPMRVSGCRVMYDPANTTHPARQSLDGPIAFTSCSFDMRAGTKTGLNIFATGSRGQVGVLEISSARNAQGLFSGCTFLFDTAPVNVNSALFTDITAGQNNGITLDSCVIVSSGAASGTGQLFFFAPNGNTNDESNSLSVLHSVLVNASGGTRTKILTTSTTSFTNVTDMEVNGGVTFTGNVYVGFDAASGFADASWANSAAKFTAGGDAPGFDPGAAVRPFSAADFADLSKSAALSTGSSLRALLGPTWLAPPAGANAALGEVHGTTTASATMTAQGVAWFSFTLDTAVNGKGTPPAYLDMDTEGSTLAPINDTVMGLYRVDGTLVAMDDDDGSGPGNANLSALSFGATKARASEAAAGGAKAFDGRDGATLDAGMYFVAVTGFPAVFGSSDWSVQSSATTTGNVKLHVRLGTVGCGLADIVSVGQQPPADGLLTGDDYVAFINAFFSGGLLADIVSVGQQPPADGLLTGDDYVAFINAFFSGC